MSCRGPWQAWRGTEHSGQSIHGKDRRARAEGGSAPGTWPAACPPPAPSTATGPARPARPAPAPQLESLRLLLSDARGEAVVRPAPGTPARSPDRGAAKPATATRLRAPQMSSFTAIVFGEIRESGRAEGAGRWREREGSPGRCSRSCPLCGARRQRTEERAPGAARQQPVRSPATEAGGAPGPVGRGWGGGGPGRVRGAGARRVEEPLQPEPDLGQEEEKEEVLEAAAGSRLRAELHCHILGFLGCRRRCEAPGTC